MEITIGYLGGGGVEGRGNQLTSALVSHLIFELNLIKLFTVFFLTRTVYLRGLF